jgi:hypothetical protein
MTEVTPRFKVRLAAIFYVFTFLAGGLSLVVRGKLGMAAGLIAGASYIAVTLLFYGIFKPVNRGLSLLAALLSLVGIAIGPLSLLHLAPNINPLVFFGFYCLLIGYLIFRSTFLPGALGALMAFGGLGWLTFLSPAFANHLFPYNMIPGILGEGTLTLWLLVMGVNVPQWREQAGLTEDMMGAARQAN